jgi:hypothetical protein
MILWIGLMHKEILLNGVKVSHGVGFKAGFNHKSPVGRHPELIDGPESLGRS